VSNQPRLYIAATGMITPLGDSAAMTAAAVRAGASGYQSSGFYLNEDAHIRMALVPGEALQDCLNKELLPEDYAARQIRLLRLASLAMTPLRPLLPRGQKLPLFIAGPEQLIETDQPIDRAFLENLVEQTDVNLDLARSRVIAMGRAGGLAAVELAFRYFASTGERFALVGGVDTFYDGRLVQKLFEDKRLLVAGNMDGFIPGEGAAFLLLSREETPLIPHADKTVYLYEPGTASEPGHLASTQPYRGEGLASAVTAALDNAPTGKIRTLYSSMNGEHFFAKEHGVALMRNNARLEENMKIEHPADCLGDLGAAFGPVAMGIAAAQLLDGRAASPCVVCCSSDGEPRAAAVMHA
jgi:3-oxoacyl-[acyl-carrier-protein] synthase-1